MLSLSANTFCLAQHSRFQPLHLDTVVVHIYVTNNTHCQGYSHTELLAPTFCFLSTAWKYASSAHEYKVTKAKHFLEKEAYNVQRGNFLSSNELSYSIWWDLQRAASYTFMYVLYRQLNTFIGVPFNNAIGQRHHAWLVKLDIVFVLMLLLLVDRNGFIKQKRKSQGEGIIPES